MSVSKVDVFEEKGLEIALAMESTSNHPIAKAIYEFCKERVKTVPDLRDCEEIRGFGIKCGEYIATNASKYLRDRIRKEAKEVISFIKNKE